MYSRPSSSVMRAPRPERMKTGVPPTAPKARTGEFTPPGMSSSDWSNNWRLRSYIGIPGSAEERGEAARGRLDVGGLEERRDDRDHVGAGGDGRRRIGRIAAPDGRDGQARFGPRAREELQGRARGGRLGGRGEHAADPDV